MKRVILMTLTLMFLSACNTISGIGKDVERAGEAVQGAAK
jgi:predicted small secreted protein